MSDRVLTDLEDRKRVAIEAAMAKRAQAQADAYEDYDVGVIALERKLGDAREHADEIFDAEMLAIREMS